MPYKDPEANRSYMREYQRTRNREDHPPTSFPVEQRRSTRLRTTYDVLARIELHLAAVEEDPSLSTATRTRCAGELLRTALKGVEIVDLAGRLKRLEEVLKQRGISLPAAGPPEGAEETETIQ